jgi:hypothetical protein
MAKQTPMTEAELNAQIERELEAQVERELAVAMDRKRTAIASRLRHEALMKEYARINAKHPIEDKYGGLGPEGHAARLKEMDARAKADMESLARVNARPVLGSLAAKRADQMGGGAGFKIKPGGA